MSGRLVPGADLGNPHVQANRKSARADDAREDLKARAMYRWNKFHSKLQSRTFTCGNIFFLDLCGCLAAAPRFWPPKSYRRVLGV